jgi:hypothetical protein
MFEKWRLQYNNRIFYQLELEFPHSRQLQGSQEKESIHLNWLKKIQAKWTGTEGCIHLQNLEARWSVKELHLSKKVTKKLKVWGSETDDKV